jgi:arginine repressor
MLRSDKNKIHKVINSSFVTNHDLLEGLRNKSFNLLSKDTSSKDLKKVNLIKKKSFDHLGKENYNTNNKSQSFLN